MGTIEDAKVGKLGPWLQALVDSNEQGHILRVIMAHSSPGLGVTVYTTPPERGSRIRYFAPNSEVTAQIVKFIRVKFECPTSDLQGIYRLKGGRWLKAMDYQSAIDLLNVE